MEKNIIFRLVEFKEESDTVVVEGELFFMASANLKQAKKPKEQEELESIYAANRIAFIKKAGLVVRDLVRLAWDKEDTEEADKKSEATKKIRFKWKSDTTSFEKSTELLAITIVLVPSSTPLIASDYTYVGIMYEKRLADSKEAK